MGKPISIFWFRRDLRLHDNTGLHAALSENENVLPIFIFDSNILDKLSNKSDARVNFIHDSLEAIRTEMHKHKRELSIYHGKPIDIFKNLIEANQVNTVYTNRDYEPYAKERDKEIQEFLEKKNINFKTYKDQVFFEKKEVTKDDGNPYVVYTPYKNKWKALFENEKLKTFPSEELLINLIYDFPFEYLSLKDIGFEPSDIKVPKLTVTPQLINNYEDTRDFPAKENGTSKAGSHLRFGTVSIRELLKKAIAEKNEVFWSELIWREFFMQILWHFPETSKKAFKTKYDRIEWRNNEEEFEKWKTGTTGYPLVDAGMRQLNETGYMHNRIRMLVGSFLCKHLLIDWRWGEAYFAEKLLDYEMASNVGNWQWVAGSGVDAAPYFRIFNPTTQIKKFDKDQEYIKKWVKDLDKSTYPEPMVDHKEARERCLKTYKKAVS